MLRRISRLRRRGGVGNTIIPQYLRLGTGSILEGFENKNDWTGSNRTLEDNTVEFIEGTQSIKITTTAGGAGYMDKNVNYDLSKNNPSSFSFYLHSSISTVQSVSILISSTTNFAKYFQWSININSIKNGWNYFSLLKENATNSNSESWSNTMIKMRIRVNANPSKVAIVSLDNMRINEEYMPAIALTFDDGNASVYNVAHEKMRKYNAKGTSYIVSDFIDTDNHLTIDQIQYLDRYGWTMGNHSKTHVNFTPLTVEQIEYEISQCRDVLSSIGVSNGDHLAFPFGGYTANVATALKNQNFKTGRKATGSIVSKIGNIDWLNCYPAGAFAIPVGITLNEAKTIVDNCKNTNSVAIIMIHDLVETAINSSQCSIADFNAIVDYINESKINMLTMNELYMLKSSDITIKSQF